MTLHTILTIAGLWALLDVGVVIFCTIVGDGRRGVRRRNDAEFAEVAARRRFVRSNRRAAA